MKDQRYKLLKCRWICSGTCPGYDKVFSKVVAGFKYRQFPEGATLLKEEDPDNGMFVIVEGRVRIEIRGMSMNELGRGSLVGEMSVLTGYPRSASIVAVTPVTVVWIESKTLKSVMKKSAVLTMKFISVLTQKQ